MIRRLMSYSNNLKGSSLISLVPKLSQVSLSQEDLYSHNKDLSQLEKITGRLVKDWLLLWA